MPLKNFSSCWFLSMKPEQTVLSLYKGEAALAVVMDVGYGSLAKQVFLQPKPKPVEVEEAIIRVEDEIMRVHAQVQGGFSLVSSDTYVHEIAKRAGAGLAVGLEDGPETGKVLTREELEFFFNRWADIVSGSPVRASEQPMSKELGAGLLILRELLHHLDFKELLLVDALPVAS